MTTFLSKETAMTLVLFAATVLIWGTTWFAIALQLGPVPVLTSVLYRFALAAVVMMGWLIATGRLRRRGWAMHRWFIALGLCLFSVNFICFYNAARFIPSGLVSVIFSLATIYNAINGRLFFREPIPARAIGAAGLGVVGLLLLFRRELFGHTLDDGALIGIGLAALGTLLFSLGNMVSRHISSLGTGPAEANGWGMTYGACGLAVVVWLSGAGLHVPPGGTYVAALIYLAVVGSALGFTTYLLLVARMGSARAAYATVAFPVVALIVSSLFEGYQWEPAGVAGLALTLAGNVLIFRRAKAAS